MRNHLCLLLLAGGSLVLAGCAGNTEERLDRLETQMQGQQMMDLRLAHMEDRLTEIEGALGEIRSRLDDGTPKGVKGPAPRRVAPVAAAPAPVTARAVPVAVAPVPPAAVPAPQASAPAVSASAVSAAPSDMSPAPAAVAASSASVAYSDRAEPAGAASMELWPGFVGEEYRLQPGGRRVSPDPASAPVSRPASPAATAMPGTAVQTDASAYPIQAGPSSQPAQPGGAVVPVQAAAPAVAPAAPAAPSSVAASASAATGGGSPDKLAYNAALALYDKNHVSAAEQRFTAFLQQYPQSALVPNAMYWLGECYYSTGRMDSAIMVFKDVAGRFPRHPKAAASLLKAGYAYAKLNDMENAQFYWQILLDDFPDSAPAALARKRMAGK